MRASPVVAAWLGALLLLADDRVLLTNPSSFDTGVRVKSGSSVTTFVAQSPIPVGQNTGSGEVAAFTRERPVALKTGVTWDAADKDISVDYQNQITIPVSVWILTAPFAYNRDKVEAARLLTNSIFNLERMGVVIDSFLATDATAHPKAANYVDFTCSKRKGLQKDIGKVPGQINIYLVNTVDYDAANGQSCLRADFIALGANFGADLLSHEMGHNLRLFHVDGLPADFDDTNVMWGSSDVREFLTEGQLFRAHLRAGSALNQVYGARPGQPRRTCEALTTSSTCPALQKRIFADGAFPSN